ncbi:MAG: class I SAM-dependent methyltransferase [Pseudomonadota bacterium]
MSGAGLPPPDPEALAHSQALVRLIAEHIRASGGWISFADYMHLALYAPGLGYYSAGARKFGAQGDFVTAPELTPLFGEALATQVAQVLRVCGGDVLELGAGSGRLAVDVLLALERMECVPQLYHILEVSPDLRQRQRALLAEAAGHLLGRVNWLDSLPEQITGVVLGNEVLDAMPVHLFGVRDGQLFERGCSLDAAGQCVWQDRPLTSGVLHESALQLPLSGGDYLSEINLAAPALVQSLSDRLVQGMILFIDYGFPRAEYYHHDRDQGTLVCHYRHRMHDDPLRAPGLTDITAHVDFTAVADAGLAAGLSVAGYTQQAHFLVNCGLLGLLEKLTPGSMPYLKAAARVNTLLQPSEMGELFKAMALTKGLDEPLIGFVQGDKRHTL